MKAFFFTKRAFRKKLVKISNDVCGVRIRAEREYCVVRSAKLIIDKKRNGICKVIPAQQILPIACRSWLCQCIAFHGILKRTCISSQAKYRIRGMHPKEAKHLE